MEEVFKSIFMCLDDLFSAVSVSRACAWASFVRFCAFLVAKMGWKKRTFAQHSAKMRKKRFYAIPLLVMICQSLSQTNVAVPPRRMSFQSPPPPLPLRRRLANGNVVLYRVERQSLLGRLVRFQIKVRKKHYENQNVTRDNRSTCIQWILHGLWHEKKHGTHHDLEAKSMVKQMSNDFITIFYVWSSIKFRELKFISYVKIVVEPHEFWH